MRLLLLIKKRVNVFSLFLLNSLRNYVYFEEKKRKILTLNPKLAGHDFTYSIALKLNYLR